MAVDLADLRQIAVLNELSDDERAALAVGMMPFTATAGEVLFADGDPADRAYLITAGSVDDSGTDVGGGEMLGGAALIDDRPRRSTARVLADVRGYTLSRGVFDNARTAMHPAAYALMMRLGEQLAADARVRLAAGIGSIWADVDPGPADYRDQFKVGAAGHRRAQLNGLPLLAKLSPDELDRLLIGAAWLDVPRGETVIGRGENSGALGLVVRGAVQATVDLADGDLLRMNLRGPGETLGELAWLDGGPHLVSYVTREPTTIAGLPRGHLAALLAAHDPAGYKLLDMMVDTMVGVLRRGSRRLVHVQTQARVRPQ